MQTKAETTSSRFPRQAAAAAFASVMALVYLQTSLAPTWNTVKKARHARDYATYHYAVQVSLAGGSPYDVSRLSAAAREEKTRKSVHPFFYPPPALLCFLWSAPLSLPAASKAFFWINQGLLLGCLLQLRKWLGLHWGWLLLLAATFTPAADSIKMGQANLVVLFAIIAAVRHGSGLALSAAAMIKMSPALLMAHWIASRRYRPAAAAAGGAVLLSIASLPLAGPALQWEFYTAILPSFSSGSYHGLSVPINIPANHSIPDLMHQLWPGTSNKVLSGTAKQASSALSILLLAGLCFLSSRSARDSLSSACMASAFLCLMLVVPVYAYEHHLSYLLLPAAVLLSACLRGRLTRWETGAAALSYFFAAWPLYMLRSAQKSLPALEWILQESKFFALACLATLCVRAALKGAGEDDAGSGAGEEPQSL